MSEKDRLFEQLCVNARSPMGPIVTPYCNGIRSVLQDLLVNTRETSIWDRPRRMCITKYMGITKPTSTYSFGREVRMHQTDISDDRHLSSFITCSVKVCYDYYELNN
jgi:hypothetical protein